MVLNLFLSEENCPKILKNVFEDPTYEFYLCFIHVIPEPFNHTLLKMEAEQPTALEICAWYQDLVIKLEERQKQRFVPS